MARHWNRVCALEVFSDPEVVGALRQMLPGTFRRAPGYPDGAEHRKNFEEAYTYLALRHFGALREDAELLSVAAGHDVLTYHLTNEVRWVFATDLYGESEFSGREAVPGMLRDPEQFVHEDIDHWRPGRLVVEYMNALGLRAEDATFDGAYSLSSIEHMGGLAGAEVAIREMARVVRPGGVVAVATECVVNGAPRFESDGLSFFTPEDLRHLSRCCPLLDPVDEFSLEECDPLDGSVSPVLALSGEIARSERGEPPSWPHVLLHWDNAAGQQQVFTSGFLAFRRLG